MLDKVAVTPGEGHVLVEGTVTDTLHRLRYGDGVLGWEGDPNMQLFVDTETGLFDVWTLGRDGETADLVVARKPYADSRLIEDVIRADGQRFDIVGQIIDKEAERQKQLKKLRDDQFEEFADRMQFALLKENGQHYGGLTRRLH